MSVSMLKDALSKGELVEPVPTQHPKGTEKTEPKKHLGDYLVDGHELQAMKIKQPAPIISPFLLIGSLILLYAERGVGKTWAILQMAISISTGTPFWGYNSHKQKVLLVDADPQANATSGLGVDVESVEKGTYQVLEHTVKAREAIIKTNSPNVDMIPAHIDLVAIEIELVDKQRREYMLKTALDEVKE